MLSLNLWNNVRARLSWFIHICTLLGEQLAQNALWNANDDDSKAQHVRMFPKHLVGNSRQSTFGRLCSRHSWALDAQSNDPAELLSSVDEICRISMMKCAVTTHHHEFIFCLTESIIRIYASDHNICTSKKMAAVLADWYQELQALPFLCWKGPLSTVKDSLSPCVKVELINAFYALMVLKTGWTMGFPEWEGTHHRNMVLTAFRALERS